MSLTINANHSSSYYLRNFYSSNRSAASTDSYRSRSSNHTLVLADSEALKKAAEALSDLDYDDSDEANGGDIYNSITAFVTAYNNFMDSSSSSDYGYIKNQKNHIKDLISEHSSDLESIGITINTKGKLEIDDDELGSAKLTKLKRIFSDSGDQFSSSPAGNMPLPLFGMKRTTFRKRAVFRTVPTIQLPDSTPRIPQIRQRPWRN